MKKQNENNFEHALGILSGVAVCLLGIDYASNDPEMSTGAAGTIGFILGYGAGWLAGVTITIFFRIVIGLVCFGIILVRIINLGSMLGL